MKSKLLNLPALGIFTIGILEAIALLRNVDGAAFGLAIAAIAALTGYKFKPSSRE